jgi:beta propeller repeat protein
MDERNASDDIYMYTISTTTEAPLITEATANQQSPWIDGNIVVWEDYRGATSDIYYYDFGTPVVNGSVVSSSAGQQYWPTVTGDQISWTEDRGTGTSYDVYTYNLSASTEINVTNRAGTQAFGYVDGNIIVWTDNRNGNYDVYMYDFTNASEFLVTPLSSQQGVARIEGNRIVWGDSRNDTLLSGIADIYSGVVAYDSSGPIFNNLPSLAVQININEGQVIDQDPFLIQALPTDSGSGMDYVEFYIDGNLVCTDTTPNGSGIYECSWPVSSYCGSTSVRVTAFDLTANSTTVSRNFTISSAICPALSATGNSVNKTILTSGILILIAFIIVFKNRFLLWTKKFLSKNKS